ncbi:MAG: glutaminyl-peptide cyclotransferase [Deltaproteobacteria bacterium]|nr:glutaminyl-peptide cyclotransferase [Deltaproteobacteria bacterium]
MSNEPTTTQCVVVQEYGPFGEASTNGVAHDGRHLWIATGDSMKALDTERGEIVRTLPVAADAGTAFDGEHLYQLSGTEIQKVDVETGEVVGTIPAPGKGRDAGLTWAEGALWVGQHRDRTIHRIDPATGAITRTIESNRFVTGVTWTEGELWHGTWEGGTSELRRVDPGTGEVLERHEMPDKMVVTGLSSDRDRFYCGAGSDGRVRAVLRPGSR